MEGIISALFIGGGTYYVINYTSQTQNVSVGGSVNAPIVNGNVTINNNEVQSATYVWTNQNSWSSQLNEEGNYETKLIFKATSGVLPASVCFTVSAGPTGIKEISALPENYTFYSGNCFNPNQQTEEAIHLITDMKPVGIEAKLAVPQSIIFTLAVLGNFQPFLLFHHSLSSLRRRKPDRELRSGNNPWVFNAVSVSRIRSQVRGMACCWSQ